MSAFICMLDRSGADLDPREIQRLAEPLDVYGSAMSSVCRGPAAVAVRHAADPPGRRLHGPLTDPASGQELALAGKLSLIDEDRSGDSSDGRSALSTWTSLARAAFRQPDRLANAAGSFVLIAADPRRCRLSLMRDHLGDLKAYYYLDHRWFIAASEPTAILRHAAVGSDFDEVEAARFLGFRFVQSERSFFREIKEIPPAHLLRVTATDASAERYWRFRLDRRGCERPTEEVLAAFRGHLRRSMAIQTAHVEPARVALSLSGGLDSTALAALAPPGVRSFSWHIGGASGAERRNIEAVAQQLGTAVHWLDGDGLYPLSTGWGDRFVHGSSPYVNAFAALKHGLYRAAKAEGCQQVMVGDAGDALYSAQEYWLRDAIAGRRPGALTSLSRTIRSAYGGDRSARRALRRLLPLPAIRGAMRRRRLPWLTDRALSLLPAKRLSPILPEVRWRRRHDLIVGAKHSELESEERRLFARCGVGRSSPFWYWPLLEMVIGLPAWWYHHDGRSKVLTIEAMRGRLPATVLESATVGLLGSFFLSGIEARRQEVRKMVFRRPRSDWPRYVRRAWLEPYLDDTRSIQFGHTILWRVICYELWQRHMTRPDWQRGHQP